MQKALAEDATVYEYDSVYDDLQQKKLESNTKSLSGSNKQVDVLIVKLFSNCTAEVFSWKKFHCLFFFC